MSRFCSSLMLLVVLALTGCDGGSGSSVQPPPPPLDYPKTEAGTDSDTYFGRKVSDPYRWLEDTRSQRTDNWVQAQNSFAYDYITALPDYQAIYQRLAPWFGLPGDAQLAPRQHGRDALSTLSRDKLDVLQVEGQQGGDGKFYYQLQEQRDQQVHKHRRPPLSGPDYFSVDNIIYAGKGAGAGQGDQVLVNANDFKIDPSDHIQLFGHQVSQDKRYLVYLLQRNFAPALELHVLDLQNGGELVNIIPNVYSSRLTLYGDGVVYSSPRNVEDPLLSNYHFQSIYFQAFNSKERQLWFEGEEFDQLPETFMYGDKLYITVLIDMQAGYLRMDPANPQNGVETFIDFRRQDRSVEFLGASPDDADKMLFKTSLGADLYRLVEVDPTDPSEANWRELLPLKKADETVYVNQIVACGQDYYAEHLDLGSSRLFHYHASDAHEIKLPGLGAVYEMQCSNFEGQSVLNYRHSSLAQPELSFSYNPATHQSIPGPRQVFPDFDPDDYEMNRVLVAGFDGVEVPVYFVHKKGLQRTGEVPVFIYSYGGFIDPLPPRFALHAVPLIESGGIYAVAQLRGGAEFGNDWYDAGRLLNKQNTYNDLIAVAEHFIQAGWTRPGKLALEGESNGGTTTAAVALQRPDLFGVVFPVVGVHDLVRYDRFVTGFAWHGDYGRNTDQAQFENLMRFSPLHNVKGVSYPPMYILTSKTDSRVVPSHSYKFAATLQNTATGTNPYLLYAFPKDNHGLESNWHSMFAFMWSAFFYHMGLPYVPPPQ